VFVDESRLSQKPCRKRSWASIGCEPQLKLNFDWSKLSVIGGITRNDFYFQIHESSITSQQVRGFVDQLVKAIGTPITIVWDGLRARWSEVVKEHVASLRGRVKLEQLPAYALELNPT
jgi:hypothetical protein